MRDIRQAKHMLQIGTLTLPHALIQAPLAGISCAPFRELFSFYTKPAYAVTEMIPGHLILQYRRRNKRYLTRSNKEGLWCIQLSGHDPKVMYKATQVAASYQPDIIDLNCGCPKPKVRIKGSGSALLASPSILRDVVSAMRDATTLPLTVKIRVAGNTPDVTYLEAASVIEQCGADALIVHGRHYSEDYDVPANYQQIKRVVEHVNIPVIANGDVRDHQSMQRCLETSGASGIMIGRGSIGRPWLFEELLTQKTINPSMLECMRLFKYHINQLATLEDNTITALFQARRFIKWYFPQLAQAQLLTCYEGASLEELYSTLASFCE